MKEFVIMDEKNNDRIKVMEILNRSQYNDEIIDGLDMSNLDLTFLICQR